MLLGLCVADFVSSVSFFLGSWAVPKDPPDSRFEEVYGGGRPGYWNEIFPHAIGTTGTCTAEGYFILHGVHIDFVFASSTVSASTETNENRRNLFLFCERHVP